MYSRVFFGIKPKTPRVVSSGLVDWNCLILALKKVELMFVTKVSWTIVEFFGSCSLLIG